MSNCWLEPLVSYYKIFFGDTAKVIIDIGTRDGEDAAFLAKMLNSEYIYAIDARKNACDQTKNKYPEFTVIHTAVSDYVGDTLFCQVISTDKDYSGSSSIFNYKFDRPEYIHNTIVVPVTTMSEIINNIVQHESIDLIKIDIEGYSYQCLVGMKDHLKKVKVFHIETEKQPTHPNHKNNIDIINFMSENGFQLVGTQYEWGWEIEDQIWINKDYGKDINN